MAYQSEIEKLEQRYRENPDQWFAALADSYRKAGSLDLALDVVNAGLAKRPNYVSGHIVLGRCLLQKPDDGAAAAAFEKVLSLDAENVIALKALSEVSERAGRLPDAVRWLTRLLEVDPMNDEAEQALSRLKQAAAASPPPAPPAGEMAEAGEAAEVEVGAQDVAPVAGFEATAAEMPAPTAPAEPEPVAEFSIEKSEEATAPSAVALEPMELEGPEPQVSVVEPAPPAPVEEEAPSLEAMEFTPPSADEVVEAAEGIENMEFQAPTASDVPPSVPDLEPMEFTPPEPAPVDELGATPEAVEAPSSSGDLPLFFPDDEPVPAAVPAAAREGEAPGGAEPEPMVTETMAELYAKQGLLAEARDIYRKLAAERPGDAGVANRLRELEGAVSGRRHSSGARVVDSGPSARDFLTGVFGGMSEAAVPAASAVAPGAPASPVSLGAGAGGVPAPTRRASDEVSLASVFGEEPRSPRPPSAPAQPQTKPSGEGFSFDEFFGAQRKPAPPGGTDQPPEDDDFKRWLKGLKS